MEMDMQEPGEMCCFYKEEHHLFSERRSLQEIIGLHTSLNHIIISCRGITLY